ncbi:MAG: hypothetical protein U1F16_05140 [Turneriella sp.]
MTSAADLVPLSNRQEEWHRRLAMIERAQSFIYLTAFYLEHDAYERIVNALQAAQNPRCGGHIADR